MFAEAVGFSGAEMVVVMLSPMSSFMSGDGGSTPAS